MSDKTILSELCSICNTNASKYRCPGCDARTCSLPCYKRHQQWAQCSGQRDPTKFVKKSQLATPAGIDHDYNFLTSIERNLEKAEAATDASQEPPKAQHRVNYQRLQLSGVTVIRAPRGLTRQKENKSHQSSTKKAKMNFVWTVEWYDETKKRVLTQTSSTAHIQNADPFHGDQHKSKKRKLNSDNHLTTTLPSSTAAVAPVQQDQHEEHPKENPDKPLERFELNVQLKVNDEKSEHSIAGPGTASEPEGEVTKGETNLAPSHSRNDGIHGSGTESMGNGRYRFFLLKPRTSSSRLVLIPLDSTYTLGDSLKGRTVLEFPTIYVFPASMLDLPEEFMLEDDYIKQEGEEQKEFDELINDLDPEILKRLKQDDTTAKEGHEEEVDSKKILDVLKQDLGGVL